MEQLSRQLGQPIIVENRLGAGGTIGIGSVAKADPDGYTLLIQSTSFAVVASTYSKPGYDSIKDFAPITALVSLPNVMIVQAEQVQDAQGFRRRRQGQSGQDELRLGRRRQRRASQRRTLRASPPARRYQHIPYKGGPEGVDLGDDRRDAISISSRCRRRAARSRPASSRSSRCRARSARRRCPTCRPRSRPASRTPNTTSGSASGRRPARRRRSSTSSTPRRVKALQDPAVKEKLNGIGGDPLPMSPSQFGAFVKQGDRRQRHAGEGVGRADQLGRDETACPAHQPLDHAH